MKQKKGFLFKCSSLFLLTLILVQPALLATSADKPECDTALKKCFGDSLLASFFSMFNFMVWSLSAAGCIMGYEWCLLYYI